MDECFGQSFVEAIRTSGASVVHHREVFEKGVSDETWLAKSAEENWIALTKDKDPKWNDLVFRSVLQSRARVVIFRVAQAKGDELGTLAKTVAPKIIRSVGSRSGPCIFKVTRSGALEEIPIRRREKKRAGAPP